MYFEIADRRFTRTISDSFGDCLLLYGHGNWLLTFEHYTVESFSDGYDSHNESIELCKPPLWDSITEIATLVVSLNDSTRFKL